MNNTTGPAAFARSLAETHQTDNPFEICENLGIFVADVPLPAGINGFFASLGGLPIVYLSDSLEERQRRVVCAHELGHALLHDKSNVLFLTQSTLFQPGRYEREADLFCASLLLSGYDPAQWETLEEVASETGLPLRLVEMALGK